MANWSCMVRGKVRGPLTEQQLREMARAGKLHDDDWVREGSAGDWLQVRYARARLLAEPMEAGSVDEEADEEEAARRTEVRHRSKRRRRSRVRRQREERRKRYTIIAAVAALVLLAWFAMPHGERPQVGAEPRPIPQSTQIAATDPQRSFELYAERFVRNLKEVSAQRDATEAASGRPVTFTWGPDYQTRVLPPDEADPRHRGVLTIDRVVEMVEADARARITGRVTLRFFLHNQRWILQRAFFEGREADSRGQPPGEFGISRAVSSDEMGEPRIGWAYRVTEQ